MIAYEGVVNGNVVSMSVLDHYPDDNVTSLPDITQHSDLIFCDALCDCVWEAHYQEQVFHVPASGTFDNGVVGLYKTQLS